MDGIRGLIKDGIILIILWYIGKNILYSCSGILYNIVLLLMVVIVCVLFFITTRLVIKLLFKRF